MNDDNDQAVELTPGMVDSLWAGAQDLKEPMVAFARLLIQTPSLPGKEEKVALLVAAEMRNLGYDEVSTDKAGNVIGLIRATAPEIAGRRKPSVMFNTHMDQVDVGDESRWPYPPFHGVIKDGEIWGRGASDLKGPLAAQVYAGALLKRLNVPMPNDVYVVAVVQEEVGGLGSAALADHLQTDYAIIGEPSANKLALGHRGRVEIHVTILGKSVHASVPQKGVNPLYSMSKFLLALQKMEFSVDPQHGALGPTSVAPTLIATDQASPNVVPGECRVVLDFRNTPADTPGILLERVRAILDSSLQEGATGQAEVPPVTLTSYTGVSRILDVASAPFGIAPDSKVVTEALATLRQALRRDIPTRYWPFATDAGHLVAKGMQVIGFGPGYEEVIHTVNERISISLMVEGMVANAALALRLS